MTKAIFSPFFNELLNITNEGAIMQTNNCKYEEKDKNYIIEMDIPGVKKEDLQINIKENILSIIGLRKKEKTIVDKEKGETKEEVVVSKYEERFNIKNEKIDIDNIKANLENGVLYIELPKKENVIYERKIEIA